MLSDILRYLGLNFQQETVADLISVAHIYLSIVMGGTMGSIWVLEPFLEENFKLKGILSAVIMMVLLVPLSCVLGGLAVPLIFSEVRAMLDITSLSLPLKLGLLAIGGLAGVILALPIIAVIAIRKIFQVSKS